tara:strand:+ start:99 stop:551 length:453 start_codon:yes stop_codon:yes gene_type:complete
MAQLQPRKKWKKKIIYSALFLDSPTQQSLLRWWESQEGTTPLHNKVLAHHCTIAFKPSQEDVEALPLGKEIAMRVVGYGQDEKAQAIFVTITGLRSNNAKPHITMAISSSGSAKDSNELEIVKVTGPSFKGVLGYFGKGKEYQEIAWEAE